MPKANLTLPDGTKVTIEGNTEEVANVLAKFSSSGQPTVQHPLSKSHMIESTPKTKSKKVKKGPTGYITELEQEGYFKEKRTLSDIQKKLEEKGHIYAQTSISPALIRLTQQRVLRRIKEKKGWVYVS